MIEPPTKATAAIWTEWLESQLLFTDDVRISDTELRDVLQDNLIQQADPLLENIKQEVYRRQSIMPTNYPIQAVTDAFERHTNWQGALAYSFQLLIALGHHYPVLALADGAARQPARLFELIFELALGRYVPGQHCRFGAPRDQPIPAGFSDALSYLTTNLREMDGGSIVDTDDLKDDGLDALIWHAFVDGRPGQLVVMGQCAIGANWRSKRSDLDIEIWKEHIRWANIPMRSFAIPIIHEDGKEWFRTTKKAGLIFDRARITTLVEDEDIQDPLRTELLSWCEERIMQLPRVDD